MAKSKHKPRCPRCGKRMKAGEPFGRNCGHPNPLYAAKSARPALAKAAGTLAPVVDYRAARASYWQRQARQEPDPAQREVYRSMASDVLKGGAA